MASPQVVSNQQDLHPRLTQVVSCHLNSAYQRPYGAFSRRAFAILVHWRSRWPGPLVVDAGCGVGYSTRLLAERHSEALVVGIDKSAQRLAKAPPLPANGRLLRGDLVDLWRLMAAAGWRLSHHYLWYPNPWPKACHLRRRWHGSPAFAALLALGGQLEVRSNWRIYLDEFAAALTLGHCGAKVRPFEPGDAPVTPFEGKYARSGHRLWRCTADLDAPQPVATSQRSNANPGGRASP
ncbi:MAG: tRNA (guanine(46)-N(7))-methyltransferase TrmB [Candidatus Competibacterales bacterium]